MLVQQQQQQQQQTLSQTMVETSEQTKTATTDKHNLNDVAPSIYNASDNEEANPQHENQSAMNEPTPTVEKDVYTLQELLDYQQQGGLWLVDELLPASGLAGLTGPSDTGKSTFLRQLALSISTGQAEFLGRTINCKTKKVAYVSSEDDEMGTKLSLVKQYSAFGNTSPDNLCFLFRVSRLCVELKEKLKGERFDLVIVDAWSDFYSGKNPNDFMDVRRDLSMLKQVADEFQCCILILHHNTKNSENHEPNKNRMNGSQAIEAKLRVVMELRLHNQPNQRLLTVTKGNYLSPEKKNVGMVLALNPDNMTFSNTGSMHRFGINGNQQNGSKYDTDKWLKRMIENKQEGVSFEAVTEILKKKYPNEDVPGSTWFKVMSKKATTITIGESNPFVSVFQQ